MRQHELIAESMEKKSIYKKIDWQEFFISVIGTAIGIAITFIVDGMLERRNKAQAQRLTAIMVIHDIDNSIDIVKEMREEEERNGELLRFMLFGGTGYLKGMDIERMYRDAKITTIYEGTNEIQRQLIGGRLVK